MIRARAADEAAVLACSSSVQRIPQHKVFIRTSLRCQAVLVELNISAVGGNVEELSKWQFLTFLMSFVFPLCKCTKLLIKDFSVDIYCKGAQY